jgi:hypothetical protein
MALQPRESALRVLPIWEDRCRADVAIGLLAVSLCSLCGRLVNRTERSVGCTNSMALFQIDRVKGEHGFGSFIASVK